MKPEQLEAIRKRSSATSGNWLADYLKLQSAQIVLTDDVSALIDEVERLRGALSEIANLEEWDYGLECVKQITFNTIAEPEDWS